MQRYSLNTDAPLPPEARGGTWLIGNFDGVHKGHQAMVAEVQRLYGRASVLTFEPHPRLFFGQKLRLLTPLPEKEALLAGLGVHTLVVRAFDATFAAHSALAFIETILLGQLGAQRVAVGPDFRFGQARAGTIELLQRFMPVHVFAPFTDETGQPYASTRIREALEAGDKAAAEKLLGRKPAIG